MSDAAFRAWVALDRWAWRGAFPTNGQLAAACGWLTKDGRTSALKAKRAVRALEGLGIARRRTACVGGTYRREGIDVRRPAEWDHGQGGGSDLTRGWVRPDRGGRVNSDPL